MSLLMQERLARTDWAALRASAGRSAAHVPSAVEALIAATTEEEAERAYWRLDNVVVVQGQLFESALFLVPVLLAALGEALAPPARAGVVELLTEIAGGWPDRSEVERGNGELGERCRRAVRDGASVVRRLLDCDDLRGPALCLLTAMAPPGPGG